VIISLNSVNELIFVMVKCGVPFEVRTEFLNFIWTTVGFLSVNRQLSMLVFLYVADINCMLNISLTLTFMESVVVYSSQFT
jgi:hypothetical protein